MLTDRRPAPAAARRKELITRLVAGRCQICGHIGQVQMHQLRELLEASTATARIIYTVMSPEVPHILAIERNWSADQCEQWLARIHLR